MCNYLILYQLVKEKKSFKAFSILSSGSHLVQRSRKVCAFFRRGSPKEYSCIIISKFIHWLRQRSRLNVFFFILSSGGQFVQRGGTISAILVED